MPSLSDGVCQTRRSGLRGRLQRPATEESRQRTLNLGLDIVDCVGRLHLKGDGLAREGLHEDLHDGGLDVSPVSLLILVANDAKTRLTTERRQDDERRT